MLNWWEGIEKILLARHLVCSQGGADWLLLLLPIIPYMIFGHTCVLPNR